MRSLVHSTGLYACSDLQNGYFTVYVDVFLPLSQPRFLSNLTVYLNNTAGVLYEEETGYPSWAPEFTARLFSGVFVAQFLVLCVVLLCVLTFYVPCCEIRYVFRIKTMFGCLCVGGSLTNYDICVYLHIMVSNTYCVVFLFCFSSSCVPYVVSFPELSISDFPFGIL